MSPNLKSNLVGTAVWIVDWNSYWFTESPLIPTEKRIK